MQLITYSAETPELNLAIDEALLLTAEEDGGEALRFWSSDRIFAVLGYSRPAHEDVHVQQCRRDGVPILRRSSGGGTVLQGPGCLNYSLVLRMDRSEAYATITGTTHAILERHAATLSPRLEGKVSLAGNSDLILGGKKFSGNAQRRLSRCVLFHGTVLFNFDLPSLERYLREPAGQPQYRQRRRHGDFVTNIPLQAGLLQDLLTSAWEAEGPSVDPPVALAHRLVSERYGREEWNLKR